MRLETVMLERWRRGDRSSQGKGARRRSVMMRCAASGTDELRQARTWIPAETQQEVLQGVRGV